MFTFSKFPSILWSDVITFCVVPLAVTYFLSPFSSGLISSLELFKLTFPCTCKLEFKSVTTLEFSKAS